jgi:Rps23 Pro-64 3,4-dihydroxylase Tpa1-like proline 4-hydroxylase
MILTDKTSQVAVYDDVLEESELESLWGFVRRDTFTVINGTRWSKGWRLLDGNPLAGSTFSRQEDWDTPFQPLQARLLEAASECTNLVGEFHSDWNRVTASVMLYPVDSGLSWHSDGLRTGAYAYYVHPEWNVQWGGELLIAHETVNARGAEGRPPPHLRNDEENRVILGSAPGTFVTAAPNRLVLIAGGQLHKIALVNRCAGDRVRCSVSGFFDRKGSG